MKALQRFVVLVLLGVWSFPAVSLAKSGADPAAETSGARRAPAATAPAAAGESAELAAREQQAKQLQDFRGGEGVYLYVGGGVLAVLAVVLLVLLIV
jgi:hypothetical protein